MPSFFGHLRGSVMQPMPGGVANSRPDAWLRQACNDLALLNWPKTTVFRPKLLFRLASS